jgi:hypothetical protein
MTTAYARELDAFKDSDLFSDCSSSGILKNREQQRYLQNRLISAFEAGWNARANYPSAGTAREAESGGKP